MATTRVTEVIQQIRGMVLPQDGAGLTDGQLLESYVSSREEAAFAALVRRHGPMVWGVCRRVLPSRQDAEDAFQATFLVLVRRAASIAAPGLLANWLHGVARQTALKARAMAARRKARERQVVDMQGPAVADRDLWDDLRALLDRELHGMPEKYRVAIVLCDLGGMTRKEAAGRLSVPEGTLAARLARGRSILAERLTRRGLALAGGALAALLARGAASASAPATVVSSTVTAATSLAAGPTAAGAVSANAAALTEGVIKAMSISKLKTAATVLLLLALAGAGAGALTTGAFAHKATDRQTGQAKQSAAADGRVLVCKLLHAKLTPDQIKTEVKAMTFTAPNGNGRRGAAGLVIQPKGKPGTRVSFTFHRSKSGYGFQVIHPLKDGHVLVSVAAGGVRLYRGGSWADIGWGDPAKGERMAATKKAGDILPLEAEKEYEVMSELGSTGRYRLWVNDTLLCDQKVKGADPLVLEMKDGPVWGGARPTTLYGRFEGPKFKPKLLAGQAGVIIGPTDHSGNTQRMDRIHIETGRE